MAYERAVDGLEVSAVDCQWMARVSPMLCPSLRVIALQEPVDSPRAIHGQSIGLPGTAHGLPMDRPMRALQLMCIAQQEDISD